MNIERLERVAVWLEAGAPHVGQLAGFNLSSIVDSAVEAEAVLDDGSYSLRGCGTVCCIAGALVQFDYEDQFGKMAMTENEIRFRDGFLHHGSILEHAGYLIGMDTPYYMDLFAPNGRINYHKVTPNQAAKVVRNLIETGEVNWDEVSLAQGYSG